MVKKVVIVGAGPSGVLLAHYLLRRDDRTVSYTEILNLHQGWISKVKKSNEKFLATL